MDSSEVFPPFLDMLRRCPVLEEMFICLEISDVGSLVPIRPPGIPLHHLRKLLLHSFEMENIEYLLCSLDFPTHGTAIHLNEVGLGPGEECLVSNAQRVFTIDHSCL